MKGTYMNNKNKEICKEKFELMYVQVKDMYILNCPTLES